MASVKPTGNAQRWRGEVVGLILLLLGGAVILLAQLPTATILGVVKDSSGAVVPSASLTAKNVETGQTRITVSGADGSYRFAALPVGSYELRVEHPGFQSQERSGITLAVGQEAVMNIALDVGPVEQTVAVTAEAPLVNTTSGSLSELVSKERVADLPLNGRNYIDLNLLQTGVVQHRNLVKSFGREGLWFSSNGAPLRSNNLMLDGALMQNAFGAASGSISGETLGVEGVQEYRVVTNSFSAEYGMTMGSQVTIVSKSGTNNFHGSAFEFLRNDNLDARNFFDRKTPADSKRLPAFVRNNFGGSFGGPIQKDKMFVFGVYEGLRERLGRTIISNTIPVSAKVDGGLVPRIDPVIKPLLTLFPDPNLPNNQLTFPFSQRTDDDYGQVRLDYTISPQDSWFGRYTIQDNRATRPLSFPQFESAGKSRNQYTTLSETHIFSPNLLNTFRFSYSRTEFGFDSPSGISGPQFSFLPGKEVGNINIGGIAGLGPDAPSPLDVRQNIFTWGDDLFYSKGAHSLKFGALINRYQQFFLASTFNRGLAVFANVPDFLSARPTLIRAITPGSVTNRSYEYTTFGFYMQDDWRVRDNLTLNLGVRYEFFTVPLETRGKGAALVNIRHDAATTLLKQPFQNDSHTNISPRFGFAWDVRGDGKTSVRGGFGLLYDIGTLGSSLSAGLIGTPPFSSLSTVRPTQLTLPFFFPPEAAGKSVRTVDYSLQQPYTMHYNLTVERQLPFAMSVRLGYVGSRGINLITTTDGNPTVPLILPDGRKFFPANAPRVNPNFDDIELKTAASDSWYNSFQLGVTKRFSRGLQFQSSYTWSRLIDTTQGQLGSGSENVSSNPFPTDPSNLKLDKGLAAFDIEHNWRFNAIYRLPDFSPAGVGLGRLLNGWWTSGILSVNSGPTFNPVLQANRSRSRVNGGGSGTDRPDLVPGRSQSSIKLEGADRFFDATAFQLQPAGFLGNAGRNILRGPGFATLDFTIAKDTPLRLREGAKLEFRVEFFNILNRVNLATPANGAGLSVGGNNAALVFAGNRDGEAPLPTAGRITDTVGTSRQIQFALKILF